MSAGLARVMYPCGHLWFTPHPVIKNNELTARPHAIKSTARTGNNYMQFVVA